MKGGFVTDTHPLVYYAGGAVKRLGRRARRAFEAYEAGESILHVPAPVVIETWMLARSGKLRLRSTLGAWWREWEGTALIHEPMDALDIIAASELDWDHRDLYDRMIVATARRVGLPLVTADEEIAEWGGVEVLW